MTDAALPIGVFDSGLGGLTVLRSLVEMLPHEDFIYLGDTARTPYGSKAPDTIIRYSRECAEFLVSREVKAVIVACNTSSAHSMETLRSGLDCPVIGTVEPAVSKALTTTRTGKVGVIGTEATIASKVYEREFESRGLPSVAASIACPLFVPVVEQGMFEGEIVDKIVELYLAPLRNGAIDTLVLGCTHYPLLAGAINKFLGPDVELVACSDAIAEVTAVLLADTEAARTTSHTGTAQYFVTDAEKRFSALAGVLMGREALHALKVEL